MTDGPQDPPGSGTDYPAGWAPGHLPASDKPRRDWTPWIIGALAVVVVAVVVAALTLTGGEPATSQAAGVNSSRATLPGGQSAAPGAIASVEDDGPVSLITDDVTCGVWDNVQTALTVARNGGWAERDPWAAATTWDSAARDDFEAVADALRSGADRVVALAAQTPHRVMRELYEAFAAYGRGYAAGMADYQPMSHYLAMTSLAAADSITGVCAAARSKVTEVQSAGLTTAPAPSTPPTVGDPADPQRFIAQPNPACASWSRDDTAFREQTQAWSGLDPNVGVAQLNREQALTYDDAAQAFRARADAMEATGRASGNPVYEDLATLGALYFRAYAQAIPLIWSGDHDLAQVGLAVNSLVSSGCLAVAG